MLRDDLDRAVVPDVHDAASDRLTVGKVDEDVVAWSPALLGLVHVNQDAPARWPGLGLPVVAHTCHTAPVTTIKCGHRRPTVTSGETRNWRLFHLCKARLSRPRPS
jgi:hypothetical protein